MKSEDMLLQIHEMLQNYRLREGFSSKNDFDVSKVVKPGSISKWEGKSAYEIFKAATNEDKTACEYIFWKMKLAISGTFWSKYLGPNGKIRNYRINNEDAWEQWLGISWMSLTGGFKEATTAGKHDDYVENPNRAKITGPKGALQTFRFDKSESDSVIWHHFASLYKQILFNSAYHANNSQKAGGIRGGTETVAQFEPTWKKGNSESDSNELYSDFTFDDVEEKIEAERFLKNWKEFAQSPELQKGTKGVTAAMVFHEVIENPKAEFRNMGIKFGISRNSCATLMGKAQDELNKYNITGQDLMNAIKLYGNEKIASYLTPVQIIEPVEEVIKENPKIDDNSDAEKVKSKEKKPETKKGSFNDKFDNVMNDPAAWAPHIREVDVANWLYYWIDSNFKDVNIVAKDKGISLSDAKYWHNKALKLLKRYGISEEDLRAAVKSNGKKAVTDRIGEDNDGSW